MTLRPGEVVLIRIDFYQTPGGILRPAVVLLDSADDDFVAAPITSRFRVSDFDLPIHQWREAGLNTASMIRAHKLTVLPKDEIVRRLGELASADRTTLIAVLRRVVSLDSVGRGNSQCPCAPKTTADATFDLLAERHFG